MSDVPTDPRLENFLTRVDKNGPNGCWLWQGGSSNGHGVVRFDGAAMTAHRAAWLLFKGSGNKTIRVRQKCNNKRCVNPDHLYSTVCVHPNDMPVKDRTRPQEAHLRWQIKELKHELKKLQETMDCGHLRANLVGRRCRVCAEIDEIREAVPKTQDPAKP